MIGRAAYLQAVADNCRALSADVSAHAIRQRLISLAAKLETMNRDQKSPTAPPPTKPEHGIGASQARPAVVAPDRSGA